MINEPQDLTIAPLARLLSGYAGRGAMRHRLIWAYDARLADIVRTTREAMIGRMRLTWWHEVLSDRTRVKGRGDPLVDALHAEADGGACGADDGMLSMIDGWEALLDAPLDDEALRSYAIGRGGGLFAALAGEPEDAPWLERQGALWALWDLSGHSGDRVLANRALAMASEFAGDRPHWPRGWSPLRIAASLARRDVVAGRAAPAGLTPRLYARVLRIALVGR